MTWDEHGLSLLTETAQCNIMLSRLLGNSEYQHGRRTHSRTADKVSQKALARHMSMG